MITKFEFYPLLTLLVLMTSNDPVQTQSTLAVFQQQALTEHNYRRAMHCVPNMVLNSTLNTIAQNYANYLAANNLFQHSGTAGLGENLWGIWSSVALGSINGSAPTESWYSEIRYYNFSNPGFSSATGHFTQVIWRASTQLGIGIAYSSSLKSAIVVANYYPAGNVIGSFGSNVPARCTGNSSTSTPSTTHGSTMKPTTTISTTASSTTKAPSTSSSVWTTFQQQALAEHNYRRAMHCVPNMVLNSTLNAIAQNYSNYLAANNLFQHSGRPGLGENLWGIWSSVALGSINGSVPTESWYSEIQYYNFNSPGFSSATGHFTQVIWRASTQLGIGIAYSSSLKSAIVVANYYPAGNVIGSFASNVPNLCMGK